MIQLGRARFMAVVLIHLMKLFGQQPSTILPVKIFHYYRSSYGALPQLIQREPSDINRAPTPWESQILKQTIEELRRNLKPFPDAVQLVSAKEVDGVDYLFARCSSSSMTGDWLLIDAPSSVALRTTIPESIRSLDQAKDYFGRFVAGVLSDYGRNGRTELYESPSEADPKFFIGLLTGASRSGLAWQIDYFTAELRPAGTGTTLTVFLNKWMFHIYEPADAVNVPERFPPLRQRIETWNVDILRGELGTRYGWLRHPWAPTDRSPSSPNRDRILIEELIRRQTPGLRVLDLISVGGVGPAYQQGRLNSVLDVLQGRRELPRYEKGIRDWLLTELKSANRRNHLAVNLLKQLREAPIDLTSEALTCLSATVSADSWHSLAGQCLHYLGERGATQRVFDELTKISVPQELKHWKQQAITSIRRRLDGLGPGK